MGAHDFIPRHDILRRPGRSEPDLVIIGRRRCSHGCDQEGRHALGLGMELFGQLGNGTNIDSNTPVQVGTDAKWQSVSAGQCYTVAIKKDGTLWAWGWNWFGQLGDGTNTSSNKPVQIGTDANWRFVSAGRLHTVAIKKDGTLWAWGWNDIGQLRERDNPGKPYPGPDRDRHQHGGLRRQARTTPLRSRMTARSGLGERTAPASSGTGQTRAALPMSGSVRTPRGCPWRQSWHTVAIKKDGTLWAWGHNYFGQLGNGTNRNSNTPVQIGTSAKWRSVSAGGEHTVAIKKDGTLWAWGQNDSGQLGNGTNTDSYTPIRIGEDTEWLSAAAGTGTHVAIKKDGTLWAWGLNQDGQLGNGTNKNSLTPVQIGK